MIDIKHRSLCTFQQNFHPFVKALPYQFCCIGNIGFQFISVAFNIPKQILFCRGLDLHCIKKHPVVFKIVQYLLSQLFRMVQFTHPVPCSLNLIRICRSDTFAGCSDCFFSQFLFSLINHRMIRQKKVCFIADKQSSL